MPFHLSLRQPPSRHHEVQVVQKPQKTRCLGIITPMRLGFAYLVFLASLGSPASEAGVINIGFDRLTIRITGPGVSLIKAWGADPALPNQNPVPEIQPVRSLKGGMVNGQMGAGNPSDKYFKLDFDPPNLTRVQDNAVNLVGIAIAGQGTAHVGDTSVLRDTNAVLVDPDFYVFEINRFKAEAVIPAQNRPGNWALTSSQLTNYGTLQATGDKPDGNPIGLADRAVKIEFDFFQPFFDPEKGGSARLAITTNLFGNVQPRVFRGQAPADFVIDTHVPNSTTVPFFFGNPLPFDSSDPSSYSSFGFQVEALAGVPEPSTWSLAVVGLFVGAGFVMRRRKLTPGEEWSRAKLS